MNRILEQLVKYTGSYDKFLHLLQINNVKNITTFLTLKDELAWGYLTEFMFTEGCSMLISINTVYIIVSNDNVYKFSTFTHKGLRVITYKTNLKDSDTKTKMNIGFNLFFKALEETIL